MRPRPEVAAVDGTGSVSDAAGEVHDQPYSRYPVIDRSIDDIIGFVQVRDLFEAITKDPATPVRDIVETISSLPATARVLPTLTPIRRSAPTATLSASRAEPEQCRLAAAENDQFPAGLPTSSWTRTGALPNPNRKGADPLDLKTLRPTHRLRGSTFCAEQAARSRCSSGYRIRVRTSQVGSPHTGM